MSQAMEALKARQEQIGADLAKIERNIYDSETGYFTAEYTNFGTVLKGFEGYLTSKNAAARNKNRVFRAEDRAFSLSSTTSPATQELLAEQDQARVEAMQYNRAAGGAYALQAGNGYGKGRRG